MGYLYKLSFLFLIILSSANSVFAQEPSLLDAVEDSLVDETVKVSGAFKSTRVINAHSIEMLAKNNLDFRILHRFGFVSDGIKQLFGLDQATMRMSFDYGLTDNITLGVGRSNYRKELDGFIKWRLLQQTKGVQNIPVTVALAGGYSVVTETSTLTPKPNMIDRSSYYVQALVGRKFSSNFSAQLSPIWVHTNFPVVLTDPQDVYAIGTGMRYKVSRRTAITFDYHHSFGDLSPVFKNPVSVGVDIETGGHVFQLQFTNATGLNERAYITETTGDFFKGDIRMGFNLSRIFRVGRR